MFDSSRGVTKHISSDRSNVEYTTAESLLSFDSDGFTLGNWIGSTKTGDSYVAWNWYAGTGTASGTTSGSGTGKAYNAKYYKSL